MAQRRVAVTGLGLVTPLGVSVEASWRALLEGKAATRSVTFGEELKLPCTVGATVDTTLLAQAAEARGAVTNAKSQGPGFITMALTAAAEAVADSGLEQEILSGRLDPALAGVAIGSGIGASVDEVVAAHKLVEERGIRRLSPFFVPRLLLNLAAGHVGIRYNLQGPNHSVSTACATGAHSIGDAYRFILYGDADAMVAGGTESTMNALSFAGFSRLKALSTKFNDEPHLASRPFDKDRDGFVMGEGAGVVVLEEMERAKKRGARIYAEVRGYGLSGDAFHLTAPSEDGKGAANCMRAALRRSGLDASEVDYINAHATSTPLGDAVECEAISRVFAHRPAVSSTKGHIGHLLGAAGAVESIFSILSVANDVVPPTINLAESDIDASVLEAMHMVRGAAEQRIVRAALSNSFGFGGTNASLLFAKP